MAGERGEQDRLPEERRWLWRRVESQPPSRDVLVGSGRVLRGHTSFLHTGNTVKHKTQNEKGKKEKSNRERKEEKEGKRQTQRQSPSFCPCQTPPLAIS